MLIFCNKVIAVHLQIDPYFGGLLNLNLFVSCQYLGLKANKQKFPMSTIVLRRSADTKTI